MSSYQKKLPRLSIANEYLVPANRAEIRRKSYSVETFVANTESKQQEDNQFASNNLGQSNHFNSQICFTKTLNDSLNNLIKNTSYYNTRFVSNQQMDSIETEEQNYSEYVPITIEVNNSKTPLNVISTESVSSSSLLSKIDSNLVEMRTAYVADTFESTENNIQIENLKNEIQTLKSSLDTLRDELNEMKLKQIKYETDLETINDSNAKHFRSQQKKILFLIKRLLDLERDDNEDSLDDPSVNLELFKDSTFRF